jgi:hypothetical protein
MLRAILLLFLNILSYLTYPSLLLARRGQRKSLLKTYTKLKEELLASYKSHKTFTKQNGKAGIIRKISQGKGNN